jgi:hypothetical protein
MSNLAKDFAKNCSLCQIWPKILQKNCSLCQIWPKILQKNCSLCQIWPKISERIVTAKYSATFFCSKNFFFLKSYFVGRWGWGWGARDGGRVKGRCQCYKTHSLLVTGAAVKYAEVVLLSYLQASLMFVCK